MEPVALPAGKTSLVHLEGESGRGHLQSLHGCEPLGMEVANPTHETIIGCLKKALLAIGETGTEEKVGEEIREVARSSVGGPKHK